MPTMPRTDTEFHGWQKQFVSYAETSLVQMKIPPEAVTALKAVQQIYEAAYEKAQSPNRGRLDTAAKNDARKALEKEIQLFTKGYLYNPAVTDNDRLAMGIRDHHGPGSEIPEPETYPEFEIDSSTIRRLVIHYRDNNSKSKAKPHGIHGAEIRWLISDAPVTDVDALLHSEFDTASPFTLNFEGHQRGKTVCFCLRWENTNGKKGPWGEIGSAIVP